MTCYVESLWSWLVCWLVWNPSWSHWTARVIWAQVWEFDHFSDCFYTCALIIWTVPWHSYPPLNRYRTQARAEACMADGGAHAAAHLAGDHCYTQLPPRWASLHLTRPNAHARERDDRSALATVTLTVGHGTELQRGKSHRNVALPRCGWANWRRGTV
jgi:hypothetical protein